MESTVRRFLAELPGIIAVSTFGIGTLLLISGFSRAGLITFVVGWFLLTPLSAILFDDVLDVRHRGRRETADDEDETAVEDPLALLRERYARGDIDEAEFERRVDALLATEGFRVEGEGDPRSILDRLDRNESDEPAVSQGSSATDRSSHVGANESRTGDETEAEFDRESSTN